MRKIFVIMLCICLVFPVLSVPVSAAEITVSEEVPYIELLETTETEIFSIALNSYGYPSERTLSFNRRVNVWKGEILLYLVTGEQPVLRVANNVLASQSLGGRYYLYSYDFSGISYINPDITFYATSASDSQVLSYRLFTNYSNQYQISGSILVNAPSFVKSGSYVTGSPASVDLPGAPSDGWPDQFKVFVDTPSSVWSDYDFLSYNVSLQDIGSFGGINAYIGDYVVPFSVSQFTNSTQAMSSYNITVIVDLRNVPESTAKLTLNFVGNSISSTYGNPLPRFYISDCGGYRSYYQDDPVLYWFRQVNGKLSQLRASVDTGFKDMTESINSTINNLLMQVGIKLDDVNAGIWTFGQEIKDGVVNVGTSVTTWGQNISNKLDSLINGSEAGANEFQSGVNDAASGLQGIDDAFQQVQKPAVDSIDVNINADLDQEAFGSYTSVLVIGMNNEFVLTVFIMVFTLALVSYVLYGKR